MHERKRSNHGDDPQRCTVRLHKQTKQMNEDNLNVRSFQQHNSTPQVQREAILSIACKNGFADAVRVMLAYGNVCPNDEDLFFAVEKGHDGVLKLLLQVEELNPGAFDSFAICDAAFYGHTECVKLLLGDPRVDPSVDSNYALRIACEKGYKDIERLLLQDQRVLAEERRRKYKREDGNKRTKIE